MASIRPLTFHVTVTAAAVDKMSWSVTVSPDSIENCAMLQAVQCRSDVERVVEAALSRTGLGSELAGFYFAEDGRDADGQALAENAVGLVCHVGDEEEMLVDDVSFFDFLAHYLVYRRETDLASRVAEERDRLAASR